jgi:hypothetical protein
MADVRTLVKRGAHLDTEMLRVVATLLREMLRLKSLAANDVTDVAGFLALYTSCFQGRLDNRASVL